MIRELDFDAPPELLCPYCGEPADVDIDPGGGEVQDFEQDCTICCRPWRVHVIQEEEEAPLVTLQREDE